MNESTQVYSLLDKGIAIVIMLFILSMISERFITWIKIYFGRKGRKLWLFSSEDEDLSIKSNDIAFEKIRENKILGLNILVSIFIALVSNADLFRILGENTPYEAIGWNNIDLSEVNFGLILQGVLGCALTGFFISLGSKFWHDLLGLLLYSKNLKSKLSDKQTYEINKIEELDEYLKLTDSDLVNLAITQNQDFLKTKQNIVALLHGKQLVNGSLKDCVTLHLCDSNTSNIPTKLPVKLPSGKTVNVDVEIIVEVDKPSITLKIGDKVANSKSPNYCGTICCAVKNPINSKFFLLTCNHILTNGSGLNSFGSISPPEDTLLNNNGIGKWVWGLRNDWFDIALISITEEIALLFQTNYKTRSVYADDIKSTRVTMQGFVSKEQTGVIINHKSISPIEIRYRNGSYSINDLILISKIPAGSDYSQLCTISQAGDSGAIIYDQQNNALGMVVAANSKFTYAIPLASILNQINCQII